MGFNIAMSKRRSVEDIGVRCAHCARRTGNFAAGFARHDGEPLCHPHAKNRPDCYHLVTVYQHETPCVKKVCYEDHDDPKKYVGIVRKVKK